jgi:hypothetical protein
MFCTMTHELLIICDQPLDPHAHAKAAHAHHPYLLRQQNRIVLNM